MEYPKLSELNCSNCTERSIEIHYHEFWEYIIKNYNHTTNWTERLYWFYHNLADFPKCSVCGKPTKFINLKTGYREFCSTKCMNSSSSIQERKKETSIKNWGVENPMKSNKVQQKLKQTNLERYGEDNYFKTIQFKNQYKSIMNNFGGNYPMQIEKLKNKIINTVRNKNITKDSDLIGYNENGWQIRKCPHSKCNKCSNKQYIIPTNILFDRKRLNIELCTHLLKVGAHHNSSLEEWAAMILDSNNVQYIRNNRKLMGNKKELDFYIKDKRIGIECNGIWSHSSINNKESKPPKYHIDKKLSCNKYDISLLHLWEDWIIHKPAIVESIILNKLGLTKNTIYARKTIIKEIDSKTCNEFLNNNHIQGRSSASVRLGLYYNDELMSLMTFSPPRVNMGGKNHKQQWELVRFCNKLNTRVVGGASKLLKYFIKTYNPTSIVSFSMNDISDGNLYKRLGFETDGKITNSYWYVEPGTLKRYHRSSFTKQQIVKKGWKDKADNTWTEIEVMREQGYFQIYDSGQLKWILNCK